MTSRSMWTFVPRWCDLSAICEDKCLRRCQNPRAICRGDFLRRRHSDRQSERQGRPTVGGHLVVYQSFILALSDMRIFEERAHPDRRLLYTRPNCQHIIWRISHEWSVTNLVEQRERCSGERKVSDTVNRRREQGEEGREWLKGKKAFEASTTRDRFRWADTSLHANGYRSIVARSLGP